jgi:uncharacterized membrane protein
VSNEGSDDSDLEEVAVEEIRSQLAELEATVDDDAERREVRGVISLLDRLPEPSVSEGIRKFTRRDIAEATVGAIIISIPMLVEDGVFDIAAYLLSTPALFLVNAAFVVLMAISLLYFADFREVIVNRPIFGLVPRRLASVLVVAFLTAAFTMTLWGRIDWTNPSVALARVSVVWTVASLGAALGDILPGESSGTDINDEIEDLGERLGIGDEEGRF